jgi:hypothetical protein
MSFPEIHVLQLILPESENDSNSIATKNISPALCPETISSFTPPVSYINGTYNNTLLLRPVDDSYVPFNNDFMETQARLMNLPLSSTGILEIKIISASDVNTLVSTISSYTSRFYNIIIDGRLDKLISISTLILRDNVLVFDAFSLKIFNIFNYTSNICKISISELTLFRTIMLHVLRLYLSFLRNFSINTDVNTLYRIILDVEQKSCPNPELWVLYNYIRLQHNNFRNDSTDNAHIDPVPYLMHHYTDAMIKMSPEILSGEFINNSSITYSHLLSSISGLIELNTPSVF